MIHVKIAIIIMFGRNQNSTVNSRCIQSYQCSPLLSIVEHCYHIIIQYCTIPRYYMWYIPRTFLHVLFAIRLNVSVSLRRRIRILHPSGWIPNSIWTYMHRITAYFVVHMKKGDKQKNINEQLLTKKIELLVEICNIRWLGVILKGSKLQNVNQSTFELRELKPFSRLNRWLVRTIFLLKVIN